MSKARAFLIHLASTAAAFAALLYVTARVWFPAPYFLTDGGWQGIALAAGVGVVAGPLLTLVIYKPGKSRKALLFDYAVVVSVQLLALAFGARTLFDQRTAMVVFADGSFYTVEGSAASLAGPNARAILRASPTSPAYAVAQIPEDFASRQALRRQVLATGRPLFTRDALLRPLDSKSLGHVLSYDLEFRGALSSPENVLATERFLTSRGAEAKDFVFVPAACSCGKIVLALDRTSGKMAGWFGLHPAAPKRRS